MLVVFGAIVPTLESNGIAKTICVDIADAPKRQLKYLIMLC